MNRIRILVALWLLTVPGLLAAGDVSVVYVPVDHVALLAKERAGDESFLRAVRLVESGDNPTRVGRAGERGSYQFKAGTWREHTNEPFRLAHTTLAHAVAKRHLAWLKLRLAAAGVEVTPHNLALCWNAGSNAVIRDRLKARHHDYAHRVSNLAQGFVIAAN